MFVCLFVASSMILLGSEILFFLLLLLLLLLQGHLVCNLKRLSTAHVGGDDFVNYLTNASENAFPLVTAANFSSIMQTNPWAASLIVTPANEVYKISLAFTMM